MASPFIPLVPPALLIPNGSPMSNRMKVLSQPAERATFSAIVPGASQASGASLPVFSPPHAPAPGHAPKVTVERDGDAVTRVHIECSCGQLIDLDCA